MDLAFSGAHVDQPPSAISCKDSRVDRRQTLQALIVRNRLVVVGEGGAGASLL